MNKMPWKQPMITQKENTESKHIKIQQDPEKLFCEMSYFKSPNTNKLIM